MRANRLKARAVAVQKSEKWQKLRFAFAITILALLLVQFTALAHSASADHDFSNDTVECALCVHAYGKDDIDAPKTTFEITLPENLVEAALPVPYVAYSATLQTNKAPRAPPYTS